LFALTTITANYGKKASTAIYGKKAITAFTNLFFAFATYSAYTSLTVKHVFALIGR